jgi:hypothetical protein
VAEETFEIGGGLDLPDGQYTASLMGVTADTGNFGAFRKWEWLVEYVDGDGVAQTDTLTQLTSAHTGPQSKSYQQLAILLGRAPKAGEKIESPNGKRAILTLTKNEKGFMKVVAVSPFVEPQMSLPGVPR